MLFDSVLSQRRMLMVTDAKALSSACSSLYVKVTACVMDSTL